jgi:superfamily II DNA or RNA helicase/diadenosine tetraphosphate (Ap4A) HIT family hydrolase
VSGSRSDCPFCPPDPDRVFYRGGRVLALWDGFPVTEGHALLIPVRHVPTWFDASAEERRELTESIDIVREIIERRYRPDGFNIGINVGQAGGQTVFHLHVHVIPRYRGDVPDPRGGVRHVIPAKANYTYDASKGFATLEDCPHVEPLVRGGPDALLPHLRAGIDRAESVEMAVAFVKPSGVDLLLEPLRDLLDRGGAVRLLTGDYLGVTDPRALRELLDLEGDIELRVFRSGGTSFHPKAYVLHFHGGSGVAYVGSSNLTRSALLEGVEWNYRVVRSEDAEGFRSVVEAFRALFHHPATRPIDSAWIDAYAKTYRADVRTEEVEPEPPEPPPEPHPIQREALEALRKTREAGNSAGLVVLATGLGKTWLSAFDSDAEEYRRILFVAHREEILAQAMKTYRRIRPEARLGRYMGREKAPDADVLFASIQTLSRKPHLHRFAPDHFDYIVIDEFHHAAAASYRKVIRHFEPKFLLGLTATPERTDGGDLLALCRENLVFRCDAFEGIRRGLLSPFRYFGVPDEVDYENIPWRSSRFDEEALTRAVATRKRARNALEQYRERAGRRTLAFCCTTRHADFMADFFRREGIRVAAVHSGPTSDPRTTSLERLEAGELDVVFSVDMFNEGVDLPDVDTVMMLRPTESSILWTQQFGRGLRKAEGKDHLTVIDYIGNHKVFKIKPRTLLGLGPGDAELVEHLRLLRRGGVELPPGCEVTYELEAIDILESLVRKGAAAGSAAFRAYYEDFNELHGQRPTAVEAFHDRYSPRQTGYGTWLRFVRKMGGLTPGQESLIRDPGVVRFLEVLESTQMVRSYKMVTLLAMLDRDAIPGGIPIGDLVDAFARVAGRSAVLRGDVSVPLENPGRLRRLLEVNPINAWVRGRGTGGHAYFRYEDEVFRTTFDVPTELRADFQEWVREVVEWRLAEYLGRSGGDRGSLGEEGLRTGPVGRSSSRGERALWRQYSREEIAALWGLEFMPSVWNVGFVVQGKHVFLLVTLDKGDMADDYQYQDRFLSGEHFQWQSQNRTAQASKHGRLLKNHVEEGAEIHLFVRRSKKIGSRPAPFVYCGEVDFVDWEGEKPITVQWRLREPVPERLHELLGVPEG